ncbi:MAG: NEW3 domain-containing protein [Planctomycetota bacterium]
MQVTTTRRAKLCLLLATMMIGGGKGLAGQTTVTSGDGLGVSISETGALERLTIDGESLLSNNLEEFHPVAVCDVIQGARFLPAKGSVVEKSDKAMVQEAELDGMSLGLTARYEATDELLQVKLSVRDTSGEDRGLLVRFALPIQAEGWSWWDDLQTDRKIGTSGTFEHSRGIREFAALPEWRDKPALNMGAHAVNFSNAITGPVGLCYAVPLDQPRIFRTGYDADAGLFYIVYDVALARQTEPPGRAEFTFYLYRCDPNWGMRSALDRYYRLFPHFFTKHVEKEGMWMAFSKLSEIDNVNEFRFAFQEGAPEPGYDDALDVLSLTYFTHAGQFANIPDYNPETDPEPSYERQLAAMRRKFQENTGSAEIFDASGLHDADGKLSIKRTSVYGHIIAQYNLDPLLPYGKHMLGRIPGVFQSYRQNRGGELDGFYYDGITTGINYRRDHFRHAGYPPIWDPVRKKPFLYNYFSSAEFAKAVAERLHADGKITMMNGAMGSSFYTAPYLDVMGAETGLRIDRSSFHYIRTICRQKPFVTLLKGNFSELTEDDFALFMKRCTAYGVFPGFFDWPPSGLGPGSRYWDHAEWYERDRPNHRKYQALCQQLAGAGWEPLTLARSRDPSLTLERFGKAAGSEVFFTVLNDGPGPVETVISIRSDALPEAPVVVDEVAGRWLADASLAGDRLEVPLRLGSESLAVLHVASKEQLAETHAGEILKNLALRKEATEIDKDRPERLAHWRHTRYDAYERDHVGGKSCLKLASESDARIKGASQWVMLYQDEPEPLRLRLRLKCENVTPGKEGRLLVDALLCHVNMKTRFTERKTEKFDLDTGTYDWLEKEILIRPDRPLRSIQLSLHLWKCSGAVWIDQVSITPVDRPKDEYVVDPAMQEWYERPAAEQAKEIESRFAELEAGVRSLENTAPAGLADVCLSVLNQGLAQRKWIQDHELDKPLRRELRELDDLIARLSLVSSTLLGVRGPFVDVPTTAVPGEEVGVRVRLQGAGTAKVAYVLKIPEGWRLKDAGDGMFAVAVPADALLGTTGLIEAAAVVPSASGLSLSLEGSAEVRVVPSVEAAMRLHDVSASGEDFRFVIGVTNNSQTPADLSLRTELPPGWRPEIPAKTYRVGPKSTLSIAFGAAPSQETEPGPYTIRAELSCANLPAPFEFSEEVLFLPGSLNLLVNPGFERQATSNWARNEGAYEIDASESHSGDQSLKLHNSSPVDRSGASQTIVLNQKTPRPIVVRGHAKAANVSGQTGRGFAIYVDIYYTDGTALYGRTINWQTGSTGWQHGQMTIEPAKPIRNVNVYLLLRGHSGTVWFDDVFVTSAAIAEDAPDRS